MTTCKKILLALTALAVALTAAGCSSRGGAVADINPDAAAQTILEQVEFQAELTKADQGAAENYYKLDDTVVEYAIYINSGTVPAEEVAVIKVKDEASRESAEKIINKRLEDLRFQFEDYHPEELVKINDPVIVSKGDAVILVLADDTAAAKKVVDGLFE